MCLNINLWTCCRQLMRLCLNINKRVLMMNFHCSLQTIKQWLINLVKTLLRRYNLAFALAGFAALAMAAISWTLETSENYWFWHRYYHNTYPLCVCAHACACVSLSFCLLYLMFAFFWNVYSFWHITIYTSSFFFLCSKANIVESENNLPTTNGNYELTHQDSLPRSG